MYLPYLSFTFPINQNPNRHAVLILQVTRDVAQCYIIVRIETLLFCNNGNFYRSNVQLKDQAEKAMFSLLNKSNELGLPIDVQLELFDKTVLPVMLHGCEICGYENI